MTTITIDRATVEQALGALESVYGDSCDALHALRAALAQQQANPPGCDHCNHPLYAATKCRVCGRVTEQAEPVEPVAWYYERDTDKGLSFAPDRDPYKCWQPLHTAPPQRKPLTEEEIFSIFRTSGSPVAFARAIERAHKIGDNT